MLPNRIHGYTLGSPPPTLACPYRDCPRYFRSISGRTRHIIAKHLDNRSESHAPDTVARTSPTPSLMQLSFYMSSPVPSPNRFISSPPPNRFMSESPPPSLNADLNYIDMDIEHPPPNAFGITRVFHPNLNGMSIFFLYIFIDIDFSICRGDLR